MDKYHNRQLNSYESAMEILNTRHSTWFASSILKLKGNFDLDVLQGALLLIQKQHPRFKSKIVSNLENFYFQYDENIKIPLVIITNDSVTSWKDEIQKEINTKIDTSKSLIRVTVIRYQDDQACCHLIITCHHAVCDGMGIRALISQILTYYHKIKNQEKFDVETNLDELVPIEELLHDDYLNSTCEIPANYIFNTIAHDSTTHPTKRCSNFISRIVDESVTKALINAVQQKKGVSVQGVVNTALVFAVADVIKQFNNKNNKEIVVKYSVYVDLRPHLKNSTVHKQEPHVASYISSVSIVNKVPQRIGDLSELLWNTTADSKYQLNLGIENKQKLCHYLKTAKDDIILMLENVDDLQTTIDISTVVSNVSKVYGDITVEEVWGLSPQGPLGYICLYIVYFRDKMFLNFSYSEPTQSNETVDKVANNFVSYITKFANNNNLSPKL